jgi:hypothetical protein
METNSTAANGSTNGTAPPPPIPENDATEKLQAIAAKHDLKPTGANPHQRLLEALTEAYDLGAKDLRDDDGVAAAMAALATIKGGPASSVDTAKWLRERLTFPVKHMRAKWSDLTDREKREFDRELDYLIPSILRQVIGVVAHHDFPHVVMMNGGIGKKPGEPVKLALTTSAEVDLNLLAEAKSVMVLIAEQAAFGLRKEEVREALDEPMAVQLDLEDAIAEAPGDAGDDVSCETSGDPPHDPETGEIIDTAGASQEAPPTAGEGEEAVNETAASPSTAKHYFKAIAEDGTIFLRAAARPGFVGATPNGGNPPFAASWSRKTGMGTMTAHEIDRVEYRELEKRAKAGGKALPPKPSDGKPPIGTSGDPDLDAAIDASRGIEDLPEGPVGKTHTAAIGAAIGDDRPFHEVLREQNSAEKKLTRRAVADAATSPVDEFSDL